MLSRLVRLYDQIDGRREPVPLSQFLLQLCAPGSRQRIELSLAAALRLAPMGLDPALLLQPVQRWIKGALLNLQHFGGDLLDAFGDCPAVLGLE